MEFDQVAFTGAVDLRELAKLAGCTVQDLKDLNPAVLQHAVRARDNIASVRVPPGCAETLMHALEGGAKLPATNLTVKHRVRRRETLQSIADAYHVSAKTIATRNGIGRQKTLQLGMVLTIPASGPSPTLITEKDPRATTDYVPLRERQIPKSFDAKSDPEGRIVHTVRRGETLGGIAQRYGVAVSDLKKWNRITSPSLRRGTRLKIRLDGTSTDLAPSPEVAAGDKTPPPTAPDAGASTSEAATHTIVVQPGDTLTGIAARHGVTIQDIKTLNGLRSTRIRSGQRLKLPAS
jgi:membrane-bound lytic murein transglycosylase D